jgi:hypothetical protein
MFKQCGDIVIPQVNRRMKRNRTRRKSTSSGGELTMQLSKWKPSIHGLRQNSKFQMLLALSALLEDTGRTTDL